MNRFHRLAAPAAAGFFLALASGPSAAQTDDTVFTFIQGGHSGAWFQPAQPGHGLFVEVLDDPGSPTGREVFVAWFAFFNGRPTWIVGQGDVIRNDDGHVAVIEASIYEGNDFPPDYDPNRTVETPWGEMLLSFEGCEQALLEWDSAVPGYGTGSLGLRRLTRIAGSTCDPDLGGSTPLDDHGDTWETGTYLTDLGSATHKRTGSLEQAGDVDVFVFRLTRTSLFNGYTLGPGIVDTVGTLYRISNLEEVELATDDDGSLDGGFLVEQDLPPGDYSLHVRGKDDRAEGTYYFYYSATPQ